MSGVPATVSVMRIEQEEANRLTWAFAISLAVHLLIWGTWYSGHRFGWWENWQWPKWLQSAPLLAKIFPQAQPPVQKMPEQETPLMFVSVSEAQATPDAPENAKFYSSKNSKAANPDTTKDTEIPKIDGKQTDVVKTEDVDRPVLCNRPVRRNRHPPRKRKRRSRRGRW
jgi:hypothetical protein